MTPSKLQMKIETTLHVLFVSMMHLICVFAIQNEHTFGTRHGRDAAESDWYSHRLLKVAGNIMDTRTIPGLST